VGCSNGLVDNDPAGLLDIAAALREIDGPLVFQRGKLERVDAPHACDPIVFVILDVVEEGLKCFEGKLKGSEGGLLAGGQVPEPVERGREDGGADTVAGVSQERGKKVEPGGPRCGEVRRKKAADSINGRGVVNVHDDGGV